MIKIAQIIDKETMGLQYLETYNQEILTQTITSGTHDFLAEVMEFDGEVPIRFIELKELSIDLNSLVSIIGTDIIYNKTIREVFTESL